MLCGSYDYFNGTVAYNGEAYEGLHTAREHCMNQINHGDILTAVHVDSCYPVHSSKKTLTAASKIIIVLVALAVGLAIMAEKKQGKVPPWN